jgi:hypothetical protein
MLASRLPMSRRWHGRACGRAMLRLQRVAILADVAHLLAAGAWLGALPGFVFLLAGRTLSPKRSRPRAASRARCGVRRAADGERDRERVVPGGRLCRRSSARSTAGCCSKACALRPHAGARDGESLVSHAAARRRRCRRLAPDPRNASAEILVGLVIVAIVGVLGVTPPAIHETPIWPFAHTLSFAPAEQSRGC